MSDRLEREAPATAEKNLGPNDRAAGNLIKDTFDVSNSRNDVNAHKRNAEQPNSLPEVNIVAKGVLVAPGKNPDEMIGIIDRAIQRREDLQDRLKQAGPMPLPKFESHPGHNSDNKVQQGSKGSVGGGGNFEIPKENQVTKEMMDRFEKATPVPLLPFSKADGKQVNDGSAGSVGGGGSFEVPKANKITPEMIERMKEATPTPLLQLGKGEYPNAAPTRHGKNADYSGGSEGSLPKGGTFPIKEENQVTAEMIERMKQAKPVPMPRLEAGEFKHPANYTEGFGTAQKQNISKGSEGSLADGGSFQIPKENQVTPEMIERMKKAIPTPMPQITAEDLKQPRNVQDGLGTAQKPKH